MEGHLVIYISLGLDILISLCIKGSSVCANNYFLANLKLWEGLIFLRHLDGSGKIFTSLTRNPAQCLGQIKCCRL